MLDFGHSGATSSRVSRRLAFSPPDPESETQASPRRAGRFVYLLCIYCHETLNSSEEKPFLLMLSRCYFSETFGGHQLWWTWKSSWERDGCELGTLLSSGTDGTGASGSEADGMCFCSRCSSSLSHCVCVCVCLGMKLGVGSCTVHHTAPNFRCKVKAPLLPQHLEGEFSCSCGGDSCLCVTFPERLPLQELASLLAALRFPLWAPPLPSPFPGSTALLAVLLRPYSFHPHVSFLTGMRTLVRCKSQFAVAAHRCHAKPALSLSPGTILSPQWAQQTYLQVCAGHVVGEPPLRPPFWWPQLLVNAALPVGYLKSGHSDEMELRPKVISSLDATWILIWTTEKSDSESQSYFSKVPNGTSPSEKLQIMQMKVTSFSAMQ